MIHPWHDVTPGDKLPQEFDCVIEIPFGSSLKIRARQIERPDPIAFSIRRLFYSKILLDLMY